MRLIHGDALAGRLRLYHYTCRCCEKRIGCVGVLNPHRQPMLWGLPLLWATTMYPPDRNALGLTSKILSCDRTDACYLIDMPEQFEPFDLWCGRMSEAGMDMDAVTYLTMQDGINPATWFISEQPARARRVPGYGLARRRIAGDAPLFAQEAP